jgi:hypothetical protein
MRMPQAAAVVKRVVIMVQENHTVDCYFRGLRPYGGNVATDWPIAQNPPPADPAHNRKAYFDWLTGTSSGEHVQFDTVNLLPYYLYLAVTGAFLENHCAAFGTNSTANHLIIVGGQSPTLVNPSGTPRWDMPSLLGLAQENGVAWRAYAGSGNYPVAFYAQLNGSANVVPNSRFITDAQAGSLPALVMLWHDSPFDEHPRADVTEGMKRIWQSVDAVVKAGGWTQTVFMLTWDDWGGYDDHVKTPALEYTPDNVQLAYGPRIPLLIFGGPVKPGIDSRWCGHASIPKTAVELLGLPALGVLRVDQAPSLADLVDPKRAPSPPPPAYGSPVALPPAPSPPITPDPTPPPPAGAPQLVGPVTLRDGSTLPPPNDAPLPRQPNPPTNASASLTRRSDP